MTTEQLIDYCKSYNWTCKIKQLHVHHTWEPSHADYNGSNGLELQQNMKAYHMRIPANGGPTDGPYRDIAQHLTLLPDGKWVTGRSFNDTPVSIYGWNTGAFAIEMVGNFDIGNDKFTGPQAQEMFKFCAFFVVFKLLNIDRDVKFHRDNPTAGKTCPGTGIDRTWFMDTLKNTVKGGALTMEDLRKALNIPDAKWAKEQVDLLKTNGLITADHDPNEIVTFGVFATVINNLFKKIREESKC
jgi:hypothetical protein